MFHMKLLRTAREDTTINYNNLILVLLPDQFSSMHFNN